MFIEVADLLKCPEAHDFQPCILVPDSLEDRVVVSGVIGCPVCRREFPVKGGRAVFGDGPRPESPLPEGSEVLQALLGLMSPGGFIAIVGSAVSLWRDIAIPDVHVIGVNAPASVSEEVGLSLVDTAGEIPLNASSVRGVVLSPAQVSDQWLAEASRIVLRGQRVVAITERVAPNQLEEVVSGHGLWVGKKSG